MAQSRPKGENFYFLKEENTAQAAAAATENNKRVVKVNPSAVLGRSFQQQLRELALPPPTKKQKQTSARWPEMIYVLVCAISTWETPTTSKKKKGLYFLYNVASPAYMFQETRRRIYYFGRTPSRPIKRRKEKEKNEANVYGTYTRCVKNGGNRKGRQYTIAYTTRKLILASSFLPFFSTHFSAQHAKQQKRRRPSDGRSLTTFNLHGALLRVVRVEMEIHRARQDQRQPNEFKKEKLSLLLISVFSAEKKSQRAKLTISGRLRTVFTRSPSSSLSLSLIARAKFVAVGHDGNFNLTFKLANSLLMASS